MLYYFIMMRLYPIFMLLMGISLFATVSAHPQSVAEQFAAPPQSAQPWVYWFWLNGNENKPGIKLDLQAMHKVGIGGVLIMEVDQGAPAGPVKFVSATWQNLFHYACTVAHGYGMQINMTNDAGWCGSGGPWITPALSMQKLVWSTTALRGTQQFSAPLPQPQSVDGYYQDIAVLAFPTPADSAYRIPDFRRQSAQNLQEFPPPPAIPPTALPTQSVNPDDIVNITSRYINGKLTWSVPAGNWTILRFGHTSTGVENHPAPESGLGLESDKLSAAATDVQFKNLMAKLVADNRSLVGNTLVSTHIDSWETGSQNWTPGFRAKFEQLRGYDPLPYLPVMTGRIVGNLDISERFLCDVRQTVSDLLVKNYAARMATLAHQHGIRLSIEGYVAPVDEMAYTGRADEPMAEFWSSGMYYFANTVPLMASIAHIYGKPILGAEAFTADNNEKWLLSPCSLKTLGDWAFCNGVQRMVIHRYAMQPWKNRWPGMTMGPWGIHFERTESWWNQSKAWLHYIARCQYLLRQGRYVADLCYLEPEGSPRNFVSPPSSDSMAPTNRPGYNFDDISPEIVETQMSVKNGMIVLADGMRYHALVLPDAHTMTPQLLGKIAALVQQGATVIGPPPVRSPSLMDYPNCDATVSSLARAMWGNCNGATILMHRYGKGQAYWGETPAQVIKSQGLPADFFSGKARVFDYTHRRLAVGTDIYFVANPTAEPQTLTCAFRVSGKAPELWNPRTGKISRVAEYVQGAKTLTMPVHLRSDGSVFIVFTPQRAPAVHLTRLMRFFTVAGSKLPPIQWPGNWSKVQPQIMSASYGDFHASGKVIDVRAKLQAYVENVGYPYAVPVAAMVQGYDPDFGVVKTLQVKYMLGGRIYHALGSDPNTLNLMTPYYSAPRSPSVTVMPDGKTVLKAWHSANYECQWSSGKTTTAFVSDVPKPLPITGPWTVTFPPNYGAPPAATFPHLISWSQDSDSGIRDFSGTATYLKIFSLTKAQLTHSQMISLNLGNVDVIADVIVNGKDLGLYWKPPYRVNVTKYLRAGVNYLAIKITNLSINRMIGDQSLPEDSDRNANGTLKKWPQWLLDHQPSPTGRYTFTTWRLWHKEDALQPSGLLGPVTLSFGKIITLSP